MTLDPQYVHQRYLDPTAMKQRDVGRAVADVLHHVYSAEVAHRLVLDSETVTDNLGLLLIAELRRAGYSVTFTGRKGVHL